VSHSSPFRQSSTLQFLRGADEKEERRTGFYRVEYIPKRRRLEYLSFKDNRTFWVLF
jgi:hypothetical protein